MKRFIIDTPLFRQILVATGPIVITGILGMTEGYSSVLLPQLLKESSDIQIDTQMSSLIASMSALPMATGCIAGGYLMEKIGRRAIHIWSCLPLIIGWLIIAFSLTPQHILIGRFLTGVSDGLLGPPTGVYIAETSHPNFRGVLIMSTVVAITSGLLFVHLFGTFLTWRLTSFICGLLPIPFAILMFFVPESPTYLAKIKRIDEAKKAFLWCRGDSKDSQKELEELLQRQYEINNNTSTSGVKNLIIEHLKGLSKPEFWKPTVIISVLFFTAQITGNNAVASYTIKMLEEFGLSGEMFNEYSAMLTIDIFRLISSVLSCVLVNKMNRRTLLMLSGYGVVISLIFLCISSKFQVFSPVSILIFMVSYVCFIALGLVPLSWTMMGEIFPLAHRGFGTAVTSLVCYVVLYLVVLTFPNLLEIFGITGVFLFYCSCTLCGTIFLTIFLPETKDKPLYVIEDHFKSKK